MGFVPQRCRGLLLFCCGHGELLLVDSARRSCCWEMGQFVQQSAQQPLCAGVLSPSEKENHARFQPDPSDTSSVNRVFSRPVENRGTYPPWGSANETQSLGILPQFHVWNKRRCACLQRMYVCRHLNLALIPFHPIWSYWCQSIESVRYD